MRDKATLEKVQKFSSYKDKVYKSLKEAILNRTFKPGDPLMERTIAEQLGVSRTPVREALKHLEHEGLVETIPWKGVFVQSLSADDVKDIIQLRLATESFVAFLVAEKVTDEDIRVLEEKHQRMKEKWQQGNHHEMVHTDKEVHLYLAQLSGNKRIIQLLENLSEQIHRLGVQALTDDDRPIYSYGEHEEILAALKARDSAKAKVAMEKHLNNTMSAILHSIEKEDSKNEKEDR